MQSLQRLTPQGRLMISWPKVPKLTDVMAAIDTLAYDLETLKATAASNKARLDTIDTKATSAQHDIETHQAGAQERQREIDQLRATIQRDRWQTRFRRGRR
jgi:chromosome segregation ATPase